MSRIYRYIICANGQLGTLCEISDCDKNICGCCSFCGRPVCDTHGRIDPISDRIYCRQHGPKNHISLTINLIKLANEIAMKENIPITKIETEFIVERILNELR